MAEKPDCGRVTSTVGSIVGMIPEGLYLLTSLALVASVIRLATAVHSCMIWAASRRLRASIRSVSIRTGTITERK